MVFLFEANRLRISINPIPAAFPKLAEKARFFPCIRAKLVLSFVKL
jgi:hypothetical protein